MSSSSGAISSRRKASTGTTTSVILSNRLWQERWGGDPAIVGKAIRLDGKPHTVVGVLGPGPGDRIEQKMYLPLAFTPDQINHNFHWLLVMGRLKPGVTVAQANAQMEGIAKRIADAFPDQKKGWQISVEPLQNNFLSRNTINAPLVPARRGRLRAADRLRQRGEPAPRPGARHRQREVALRSSLGASPRQIATQFLAESVVLALLGGLFGLGLAVAIMRAILAVMPAYTLPSEVDVRLSIPVLLFTVATVIGSGILFGCAPAWQAIRSNLSENLKEGARGTTGGRHRVQRALVVAEFALALTLLAGGGPGHSQPDEPEPGRPRLPHRKAADLLPARAERTVEGRRARHPLLRPARRRSFGRCPAWRR